MTPMAYVNAVYIYNETTETFHGKETHILYLCSVYDYVKRLSTIRYVYIPQRTHTKKKLISQMENKKKEGLYVHK